MQAHRLVEARIFVQYTLQLVRRVEQTLVDTLLDIALRIVLVVLTQSIDLVDEYVHMNIRILHVRSDYHSIQAHEGIKVLVLRIHDINHGAHIRPWYIEGHLGTRPALVRVRCAWTIGGPVRKGTPRHIEQLQCLERIHVHFLRTHRGRQEEGIIRLERFIHDFADARFPRATRSDHENFASRSIRHRIVLGRHARHHRPRVASPDRWARQAPSHCLVINSAVGRTTHGHEPLPSPTMATRKKVLLKVGMLR